MVVEEDVDAVVELCGKSAELFPAVNADEVMKDEMLACGGPPCILPTPLCLWTWVRG